MLNLKEKSNILDKYLFNPLYFMVGMVVITLFTSIPLVHFYIGGYVKYILAYGILISLFSVFSGKLKEVFSYKPNFLLFAFAGSYLITILLHRESHFSENISQWVYMVVFFYIFCGLETLKPKEERTKDINIVSIVFITITFAFALISFAMFAKEYTHWYQVPNSESWYAFGIEYNRLGGLYNPNTCGALAGLSIVFAIRLTIQYKSKLIKALLAINIFIQYLCLVLSYSRASAYSLYIVLGLAAFYITFAKLNNKQILIKTTAATLAMVSLIAISVGIEQISRNALSYLPGTINSLSEEQTPSAILTPTTMSIFTETKPIVLDVEKVYLNRAEPEEITNGRIGLWKVALETFKSSPAFGIPESSAYDFAFRHKLLESDDFLAFKNGGYHNLYISVLTYSGIVGFVLMATYVILTVFSSIRKLVKRVSNKEIDYSALFVLLTTIMFLISELAEVRILYRISIFNVVFWISFGNLISGKVKDNEQKVIR